MLFTDALGNSFKQIPKEALRIVSLVPSQTELLVDLGLEKQLVGITKFCIHPKDLRERITVVGGTKQLHEDKVRALKPNLILCNKEENTKEMVEALQAIAPVWVTDMYDLQDALNTITSLGDFLGVANPAASLVKDIKKEASSFADFMRDKPERKVIYLIWKNPYMAAGRNSFIDYFLSLNKMQNTLPLGSRYPEVTPTTCEKPEVILLSSEPYPFTQNHQESIEKEWGVPSLLVDGEYFSWYGSRMLKAFAYFKSLHS